MKFILIIFTSIVFANTINAQNLYGNWELKKITYKGGEPIKRDKMFLGDGLEIHLGHKSHLSITVFHDNDHKVKHKDSWYEGDDFIILNDKEWGNTTYTILKIDKKYLTLERKLTDGIENILVLEKKNPENHHYHFEVKSE